MIKVQIDGTPYNFPESWDDIMLGQLMAINDINDKKFESDIELSVNILAAMSDIPIDVLLDIPLDDLNTLSGMIEWFAVKPKEKLTHADIDGVKYIPINTSSLSSGEVISFEVINKIGTDKNLDVITAILIRPEVDGRIEKLKDMLDIQERANIFKDKLSVSVLWPIVDSFFNGAASFSLKNTQDSLNLPKVQSRLKIVNS